LRGDQVEAVLVVDGDGTLVLREEGFIWTAAGEVDVGIVKLIAILPL
jgi:hypothetical protein